MRFTFIRNEEPVDKAQRYTYTDYALSIVHLRREWPVPEKPIDKTKFGFGLGNSQPKGHRHDREAPQRLASPIEFVTAVRSQ